MNDNNLVGFPSVCLSQIIYIVKRVRVRIRVRIRVN
jgi:hypothetical protein